MEEEELFDEFGNYIGPIPESTEPAFRAAAEELNQADGGGDELEERFAMVTMTEPQQAIVLHEDKQYFASAEETYGKRVEVVVQEEDTQHLSQPIIAPIKDLHFEHLWKDVSQHRSYDDEFLMGLMRTPERVRSVLVAGALHHGKTSLIDLLMMNSHRFPAAWLSDEKVTPRYMDGLVLERQRGISLKAKPVTICQTDSKGTSWVLNLLDTPGHLDFHDELLASLPLCQGLILVVDPIEGLTMAGEKILKSSIGHPIILVLNKIERLALELRLPPNDAFFKLRHTIEEINTYLRAIGSETILSPERGNVLFSSTLFGSIFSLDSFATNYFLRCGRKPKRVPSPPTPAELAKRLWGDIWWDPSGGKFMKTAGSGPVAGKRTFVTWILEPLWKLLSQCIGEDEPQLKETLASLNIKLSPKEHSMNTRPLISLVMQKFLGPFTCLMDSIQSNIPAPQNLLEGSLVLAGKAYPNVTATQMNVLVQVAGTEDLVVGQSLTILNESSTRATVTALAIPCGRYTIPVERVPPGAWALVSGIDGVLSKPLTWLSTSNAEPPYQINNDTIERLANVRIALEPVNPSDLPKLLDGIRMLCKSYPALQAKVEESGEHALLGVGELHLDSALHDLRQLYARDVELKLSDPTVRLTETALECSFLKCYASTPNAKNRITMIAEPLEKGLPEYLDTQPDMQGLGERLRQDFGWDALAVKSLWSCQSSNVLLDDTLPDEVDKGALAGVKSPLQQGFNWAVREGPLCEEPIRGCRFRILDALIAAEASNATPGQLIPAMRRVCYSAFLTAAPRLMEPMNAVEIWTPKDCVEQVYQVLAKRRGHVTQDTAKPGTPLYVIKALLPALDSFGFETDLRISTLGAALPHQHFDHWQVVPGDPLDRTIKLVPLEPSPAPHLARDLLLKTRRRKGLPADVSAAKFFDDPMLVELAREQATAGIGSLHI